ncbi:MAG: hypothetical protein ACLTQG_30850 [Hungatella sp.]|uniref:hypothetical protein n=1 Tax=Hungatella sp. TaxID=2613924 RepID=UPI003994E101
MKKVSKSLPLYLLLLPSFILLLLFSYLPMGGLVMAFQDFSPGLGLWESPWVGLANFKQFFRSYQFWITIKNTLILSFYGIWWAFHYRFSWRFCAIRCVPGGLEVLPGDDIPAAFYFHHGNVRDDPIVFITEFRGNRKFDGSIRRGDAKHSGQSQGL